MSRSDRAALMASVFDRPFAQTGPRRVEIPEGASLAEIVRLAVPDPVLASHVRIQLDGEWIEREGWDCVPEAGACLTLAVRPAGGDGGNKFLRTLLQIAVVAVATWVGGGAGGAIASKFWAAAAAASVMVVGNLAINALVPPPQPSLEPGRFDRGYTIEGARNQYDPYGPVTVSFGEVRIFPKFQGLPVQETHGDDTYIRFLLSLGPMPLEIVPGSIKIGETEIDTFQGVEIETRLKPTDPPLTLYARDPFAEQVGATLTPEAGWITRTTAPGVTEIIAVIAFPIGLGGKNKKGNDEYASATVAIEYQPVSADPATGAWSSYRASAPLVNDRLAELGENRLRTDPFLDIAALDSGYEQAGASSGPITWRRKESGKPFQREVRFAVPQGQYRVRVRRTDPEIDDGRTANRVQFAQLISIAPTDPNPEPEHAVMAVRIKASDQLSGVVDTLNLVLRRIAPTLDPVILEADEPDLGLVTGDDWTGEAVTGSPADAALFAMRGPMVVNPTPDDEIDWPAWAAFARWCRLKGYRFDYGLTGPMSRGDFVRLACAAGRARPVRINGKWSVVIDGPRADGPRQLFTARNVSNFRVVRTFPGEVHALRVRFPNRFEGYREDERVVYFEGYSLDGSEPGTQVATKIEALDLPGVTDPDQVYELAHFYGATAMQQTERFSFDCDIEYLVSNYGDLVAIQHPVMVLGLGAGRIVEVETNASDAVIAITLDRSVEMIADERYGLAWRRVIESQSGAAAVEVQGAFEVDAVAGETTRLVPTIPVSPADGPRPRAGDLVAFGHYGEETARALIKQITPRAGFEATVETVLEAPIRYQAGEGPIPTHNTALVTPPRRRPPSPELVAVNVTPEQIHISLSAPAGYEDRIAAIEASWRLSPEEDAEARWTPLAPLGADSRVISFTPPDPAAEYDFLITAIDGAGRRSDPPLIVSQIAADNVIDAPRNVTAIGAVSVSANGVRQPVLQIAAEPDEDQTLTELVVEIRPSGSTELADFQPLAVLPPDRPNRDVRDIAPGATLDVGFRYRARRGDRLIYSAYEIVEDVTIPDVFSASEVGGLSRAEIEAAAQAALDRANEVSTEVEAAAQAALDRANEVSGEVDDLARVAAAGDAGIAVQIERLDAPGGNLVADSWSISGGARDWYGSDGLRAAMGDRSDQPGEPFASIVGGGAPDAVLTYGPRKPVRPGERYELNVSNLALTGLAASPTLELVVYSASSGGSMIETHSVAVTADAGLVGGFVTIGADGWAEGRVAATGAGEIEIDKPVWRLADEGQTTLSGPTEREDSRLSYVRRLALATADLAAFQRGVELATENASVRVEDERVARISQTEALVQAQTSLSARATALEDEFVSGGRVAEAEASITALQAATADLDASKAEASTVDALSATVGNNSASITALQTATADLDASKAEASTVDALSATVGNNSASITALQTATADLEASKAEASTVDALSAMVGNNSASITALQTATADLEASKAEASTVNALSATVGSNSAQVIENAGAIATLNNASAIYEVLVAASASNPAIVRLLAGLGGSEIALAADVLRFINDLPGQGPIEAMSVQNGVVEIIQALVLATGATIKSADERMEIGQLANGGFGVRFRSPTGEALLVYDQVNGVFEVAPGFLSPGSFGVNTSKTLDEHDMNTGAADDRLVSACPSLILYTEEVPNIAGMIYEAEAKYFVEAWKNSFEWFSFSDQFSIRVLSGVTGRIRDRRMSTTSNTGAAPASGAANLVISDEFSRVARAEAFEPENYSTMKAGLLVKATDAIAGSGYAYTASNFDASRTRSTHKITEVRITLRGFLAGPTVIV